MRKTKSTLLLVLIYTLHVEVCSMRCRAAIL